MVGEPERRRTLTVRDRWTAAGTTVTLAVLYFALRSRDIGYDALAYSTSADIPSFGAFFHSNHPLFTPALWCVMRVVRGLGYAGSSLTPPAALSALWAAAASGGFYLLLRRIGARPAPAALATAAVSFSAAWWFFAGLAEPVASISFFTVGALFLAAPRPPSWRRALAVGCWLGVATAFHITLVLLYPVACLLVAGGREGRWRRWAALSAVYAVTASVPYIVISQCVLRHEGAAGFLSWIGYHKGDFAAYGIWAARRFPEGLRQILIVTAGPRRELGLGVMYMSRSEAALKLAPAAALVGLALGTIGFAVPRLWREHRRWLAAVVVWFVIYQLFFTWWESYNPEWWVGVTLPVWLLFGLAAPARRAFVIPAAALVLAVAAVNLERVILPSTRRGCNGNENAARALIAASHPGDNIWVPHSGVALWIRHLAHEDRTLIETGEGTTPGSYDRCVFSLAGRRGFPRRDGANTYLTDYELDNPYLGEGYRAKAARKALFKVICNGEPTTLVDFYDGPHVLYRCSRAAKLKALRIYEAEWRPKRDGYKVLREPGSTRRFNVVITEEGRYVICLQARGTPANGKWPTVSVAVDGDPLSTFAVTSVYWWFYKTRTRLKAGKHKVIVELHNGLRHGAGGRERFVYLNRLAVYRDPAAGRGAGEPSG